MLDMGCRLDLYNSDIKLFARFPSQMTKQTLVRISKAGEE